MYEGNGNDDHDACTSIRSHNIGTIQVLAEYTVAIGIINVHSSYLQAHR
jgi:hypothetical protein